MKFFILLVCLIPAAGGLFLSAAADSVSNAGSRYLRNYTQEEYDEQPQNWCILQDKEGRIYSANQGGLLVYDGVSWRFKTIPNLVTRSLALGDDGNLYVGGVNEIGYFTPGPGGSLSYISLVDKLEASRRNFSYVLRCHTAGEGIYFRTKKFLFRWNPAAQEMKTWRPLIEGSRFYGSFVCGGRFFIRHKDIGLMQMTDGELQPVPGGKRFGKTGIFAMFPYDDRRIVIGTRSDGLFLYDGKGVTPFPTELDEYLREKKLSYGIRLSHSPGAFALATLAGGLVIMDERGRVKERFTKASGLQDDNVKYVFEDSSGNLWAALNNGISRIESASPISIYDHRSNLPGIVMSVTRHGSRNHLYAGATRGVFYLPSPGNAAGFQPVPGITGGCRSLLSINDFLFAATDDGLFQLYAGDNEPALRKVIGYRTTALLPSKRAPRRIWAATTHGLYLLFQGNGEWAVERKLENVNEDIVNMVEDEMGNLWLGALGKGVFKIHYPTGIPPGVEREPVISRYDTSHGLPHGDALVFMAAGHIIVSTRKGIYRFDGQTQGFIPDTTFGEAFTENPRYIFRMVEGDDKTIWFVADFIIYRAAPRPDGTYALNSTLFSRLPESQTNAIYLDPMDDAVWFARQDGLTRFDTGYRKNYRRDFRALVRRVSNTRTQAVIFGGAAPDAANASPRSVFDYKDRNIRFEYAAPFFEDESRTRYAYLLEGYDDDWSAWTDETRKDYTNLDAGTYTFRIRAKNVYEHIGKEDVYRFKVLPPWYQTWWAYIIYVLGAFLVFNLFTKWRHQRLVKEKKQLEQTVKDRTREIEDKNRQLETQSEQLKELDEAKSRFFANISHEFRTPLTLIMGPLEQMLSRDPDKKTRTGLVHLMLRNARRLLNLINQLLELARLDSGKMKLKASEQNIVPFLRSVVMCFESLAAENKVKYTFREEDENIPVYFDGEKLEKIITNLLSNAFKYTPAEGSITVTVRTAAAGEKFPDGCVEISVRDTGAGIPENQLPYIFDRFHRVEGGHEHKHKGTGIGLALTKELVELHHGAISVTSDRREGENRGTEFTLRLPGATGASYNKNAAHITDAAPIKETPAPVLPTEVEDEGITDASQVTDGVTDAPSITEPAPAEPGTEAEEKPLILVVDDNPDVRIYIRGTLEPDCKIIEAADGKEGILRAKEILPDLIVSDVMMPDTDGYELTRTLKNDVLTSHIPIILLTAKVSEESELEGLETGADDYITKPFSPAVLTVRVRNLIDLRRQLQSARKNGMALQPEEIPVSPIDDAFYKTLQGALEDHLPDPDFNVEALSGILDMSQATLYRKVQALTGESPNRFMRSFRIKRAAQLLAAGAGGVSDVAGKVGFADKSYFAKCFKEQFNRLPSDIHSPETDDNADDLLNRQKFSGGSGGRPSQMGIIGSPRRGEKSPPGRRRQEIVLVVEDSEDARGFIRQSLESDYRVVEASDGGEGIARAMEIIPDLIISDVMMPVTDGYELCAALKKDVRTSHIPIVLLTAKASEESKILGLETGADDYVTKPFSEVILRARIQNLIRLRGHLQENRHREMTLLPAEIKESELDREFLKELNTAIAHNLSEPEFNVDQLAGKLYMSSATLYRKVRALTGETPSEYIRSYRLRRAARLFKEQFGSVTEVAFEVGFSSRAYFARCFKEKFHQLPSDYMAAQA